jgi:hypothetical protein
MKKMIVGIFVLMLLITTALPVVGTANEYTSLEEQKVEDNLKESKTSAQGNTWYVDDSGDNDNGGTSWQDAWQNISYTLISTSVNYRDIIRVGEGIYDEKHLEVYDDYINISGNGSDVTIIDGGGG